MRKRKENWLIKRMEAKRKLPLTEEEQEHRSVKFLILTPLAILFFCFATTPVYASGGDPLTTINNLSDFIFGAIKAIGFIMLGFGVVQIGLSLKSHDASQRANGMMTFFGGVIIAFAKNILDLILA